LAGALLFDDKICQCAALFWFGLQDVGILYSRAVIQRTMDFSSKILEHGSAEKIAIWAHANCDLNMQEVGFIFAQSGSDFWALIKYSRSKIKNKKIYSGWCPIQGLSNGTTLMQIQSGRTIPWLVPGFGALLNKWLMGKVVATSHNTKRAR
jgi:hypothetical protein